MKIIEYITSYINSWTMCQVYISTVSFATLKKFFWSLLAHAFQLDLLDNKIKKNEITDYCKTHKRNFH